MPKAAPSNAHLLTEGARYISRKKKSAAFSAGKGKEVESVVFDDESRQEFLTGFSKRKKARIEARREKAKERDRQEKKIEKKEFREARKKQARENFEAVERAYGVTRHDDDDEFTGIAGPSVPKETEEDYSDTEGDFHATVTIVEDFDPSSTSDPLANASASSSKPIKAATAEEPLKKIKMNSGAKPKSKKGLRTKLKGSVPGVSKIRREKAAKGGKSERSDRGGGGKKGKK